MRCMQTFFGYTILMSEIQENVPLSHYSTMRLGGNARYLTHATSNEDIESAWEWAMTHKTKVLMIGSGSNVIFGDDGFDGLVIVNQIRGITTLSEDNDFIIKFGGGEPWDAVVEYTVDLKLTGIEALTLIPGTAGSAPVQNIGAYGQQIADTLISLEAFDTESGKTLNLSNEECHFKYRSSRFNREDKGRFLVLSITLKLTKGNPKPPFYPDVEKYIMENSITEVTPHVMRQAVYSIRTRKLPDPAKVANCGSFFYNPVVSEETFNTLQLTFPELKAHITDDQQLKLYAGQLIDMCGFKGIHDEETGMGTWPNQALVIINEKARSTADLLRFKQKIVDAVKTKFGIELQQEPELL